MTEHVEVPANVEAAFAHSADDGQPIVMLNLLRYRTRADYTKHPEQNACPGREAYRRYAQQVSPLLERAGAHVEVMGTWDATLIGAPDECWDDLLVVRYPSRAAFIGMLTSSDYRNISFHRTAALSDSRLIAFKPGRAVFQT